MPSELNAFVCLFIFANRGWKFAIGSGTKISCFMLIDTFSYSPGKLIPAIVDQFL